MDVGLVHDYLLVMRGAERTFAAMTDLWPEAPLYTLLYDEDATDHWFSEREVHSSMLQGSRVRQRGFQRMLPLFPHAVGRLPVWQHELVISSSSAFAHGVRPRSGSTHICYCHTPFRYAWHEREPGLHPTIAAIRRWDRRASARVTDYVAVSAITRERIGDYYGRDATVIHPPVEVDRFTPAEPEDYLLVVAELSPHKHVDRALEAAKLARKKVKVVGSGPEYRRLEKTYGDVAEFDRRVADEDLADVYARAQALIVANVEEFGIAAVEAQAAGRPVVGIDAGGLQETVVQGVTGVLVAEPTAEALADALTSVDFTAFDSAAIHEHAQQFSVERFRREFRAHVGAVYAAS
jgi:glycosyltransferase involved in cell wall biosynthesis